MDHPGMNEDLEELDRVWGILPHLPLDEASTDTILVAGAYKGRLMDLLLTKYPKTRVIGFEPQPWAEDTAVHRLTQRHPMTLDTRPGEDRATPRYWIEQFAIGAADGSFPMGEWETDACSFVNTGPAARASGEGMMREWWGWHDRMGLHHADWLIANMEGYEFVLLPHILATEVRAVSRWKKKVSASPTRLPTNLLVQWHQGFGVDRVIPELLPALDARYELVLNRWPQWTWHRLRD